MSEQLTAETAPVVVRPPYVVPRVNLLPPEIRQSSRLRVLQVGLVGGVLVAAALVTGAGLSASNAADQARADLLAAQNARAEVDAELAGLAHVRELTATVDAADALLAQVVATEVGWSRVLDDLSLGVPDHVWIESMTVGQTVAAGGAAPAAGQPGADSTVGSISFTGRARSHDDVAVWLEALAAQPGLVDPTFSTAAVDEALEQETVAFTSTVNVTPEALTTKGVAQ